MERIKKGRLLLAGVAMATGVGVGANAAAAQGHMGQDTECMQAGIATLKSVGLFDTVARDGLPIETAVSVGVTVREGADISDVPNPIPLNVVLADHRAGDDSLFVYPWCS